jgi:hypothetical protein
MIYRGTGFLGVVRFGSSRTHPHPLPNLDDVCGCKEVIEMKGLRYAFMKISGFFINRLG